MSMFQEVKGVCMGFQRGAGGFEFRALTAWGEKLLSSLVERALMLRNRLPDGRGWKRLWKGWVGFFTILVASLVVQGKFPGWRGEEHRWSLQLCSLFAGGSCGLLHYSSHIRQWCSWSCIIIPANIQQLRTAIEEEWTNIPQATINNMINSPNTVKLHMLEWPFIVASLRHNCVLIMLSNQHLEMPHLWDGWIISAKEKCLLTQI